MGYKLMNCNTGLANNTETLTLFIGLRYTCTYAYIISLICFYNSL